MNKENTSKFCESAVSIIEKEPINAGTIWFSAKFLVQATLPHRDPGSVESWGRSNGRFSIVLQPGVISSKNSINRSIGLPYGNIPRLILPWVVTEAKRTKSREILFDSSLSSFMKSMGFESVSGGKNGSVGRFRDQLQRLFSMSIFIYDGYLSSVTDCVAVGERIQIAKQYHLSWGRGVKSDKTSYVVLDQDFFERVINKPVPVDLRALKLLKNSPLALDLYSWLTYRVSYLSKRTFIPWRDLMKQLGSEFSDNPQGLQGFKRSTVRALNKISTFWELKIDLSKDHLVLFPSRPHVKRI